MRALIYRIKRAIGIDVNVFLAQQLIDKAVVSQPQRVEKTALWQSQSWTGEGLYPMIRPDSIHANPMILSP